MSLDLLGIYREPPYSPGRHTSNDARILQLSGQALERQGLSVQLATLEEARNLWRQARLIFSMCQGPKGLDELAMWKAQGAKIVNDPAASRRTYRHTLCALFATQGIPFPQSHVIDAQRENDLSRFASLFEKRGAWLKRHDVHATQAEDVLWIPTWQDLTSGVARFNERGLRQVILQEHLAGDEVKFYAVRGHLFWPFYPKDSQGYPFEEKKLQAIAERAAQTVGLGIYGGDAIISPNGDITLIDLNDWPSFAPCRGLLQVPLHIT